MNRMIALAAASLMWAVSLTGQSKKDREIPQVCQFTIEKNLPATPVKDQHRSGTCWSYASVSFFESELLRIGEGEHDLSEAYFVRKAYELKAEKFVRMHGKTNFGNGGLALDAIHIWRESGMVPQSAYDGITTGDSLFVHGEMDGILRGYVDQVIKNPNKGLTPVWKKGFDGILDVYMGDEPTSFTVNGRTETPLSYANGLGLDPDDYLAIGSFTHHPFYRPFILEIPDNWIWGTIQNVPLEEMMEILEYAIENGYTACWDTDVSEKGFNRDKGIARIPTEDTITQELRQEWFDNYQTTDDHLMHITGTATDQEGKRFYLVKNSWGPDAHQYNGYLYASENYMRAKTIFLMVHRDAIPSSIAGKMGL